MAAHVSAPAPVPIALSARTQDELRAQVEHLRRALSRAPAQSLSALSALAHQASRRRAPHDCRLVLLATSAHDGAKSLDVYARTGKHPHVIEGRATARAPLRTVWVYTGMGPQWHAMGQELFACEPVFRSALQRADAAIQRLAGWSLLEELSAGPTASRMARTEVAQPSNLALQMALTELLRAWGLAPDAVAGHSIGEVGAAYAAGVLPFDDALELACHRGRILARAAGEGGMLAAGISLDALAPLLEGIGQRVSMGAINGPASVTLSGRREDLETLAAELGRRDIFRRMLQVEVPYHCALLDPLLPELQRALAHLLPRKAQVPFYSTVTAGPVPGEQLDAPYWVRNMREPVRFSATVDRLLDDGFRAFVEVGPHPVLEEPIRQCAELKGHSILQVASLRRGRPEALMLLTGVAKLHGHGRSPDWTKLLASFASPTANPPHSPPSSPPPSLASPRSTSVAPSVAPSPAP